jgi:hypothetical protein
MNSQLKFFKSSRPDFCDTQSWDLYSTSNALFSIGATAFQLLRFDLACFLEFVNWRLQVSNKQNPIYEPVELLISTKLQYLAVVRLKEYDLNYIFDRVLKSIIPNHLFSAIFVDY